jgi:hypothetical protein
MNTYRSLTDALTAARDNYKGTAEPQAMVVLNNDDMYSALFAENTNDATAIPFQAGLMGFWGASAREAYRNNNVAVNAVRGFMMLRNGGGWL